MTGPAPVEGMAVPPGVQADEVEGDGGLDMFEAGFRQSAVAGAADPGDGDALPDGAFDTGAEGVSGLPVLGVLLRAGGALCLVDVFVVDGD